MISSEIPTSMNRVIIDLELSKGSLYYKDKGYPASRKGTKQRDSNTVAKIRTICNEKRTYGSPRVRAILKRDHDIKLTHYMTHAIMNEEDLLIHKHEKRQSRMHTGKISVGKSNMRWCSDITSIKAWDKTKGRFAYIIDCCDRSVIAWRFSKHLQASDIEQMMQEAIFKRFGGKSPKALGLQFLHDNGPEYIEKQLKKSLAEWDVEDCNTPTYSPQSNGMSESFNGTFKRDYVYMNCLDDFETIKNQMEGWINEYNTYAPHSSLDMMTPHEYFENYVAA